MIDASELIERMYQTVSDWWDVDPDNPDMQFNYQRFFLDVYTGKTIFPGLTEDELATFKSIEWDKIVEELNKN